MPKFRVYVKSVEYGNFIYEGSEEDLKENMDEIITTAEEEGLICYHNRETVLNRYEKEED